MTITPANPPATSTRKPPFQVAAPSSAGLGSSLLRATKPAIERTLRFPALNALYEEIMSWEGDDRPFAEKSLDVLHAKLKYDDDDLQRIPNTGPLIVVANHPFGGVEGLALLTLLRRVRPDVKLMANELLSMIPELRDSFFFVDVFEKPESKRKNLAAMRSAYQWLNDGGVLGVFPAGEVSHLNVRQRAIVDPPWSDTVARMAKRANVPVLPVFFDGRNSNLFQIMGMVHPRLRTMMLPREMLRRQREPVSLRIGHVVPQDRLATFAGIEDITAYLRVRTYLLNPGHSAADAANLQKRRTPRRELPVVDAQPIEKLRQDIDALPEGSCLLTSGKFDVLISPANQLPHVLQEIGRLREICFRKVGEGTGKATDLDAFDHHYLHLFIWQRETGVIAGAYRMGPTDTITAKYGKAGLYTSTLFRFKQTLLDQINPALELGRSFVHHDHQRSFQPLKLLWNGIGAYCAANPQYRMLFGPVSISAEYSSLSKHLLVAFLTIHKYLPNLGRLLKPKNPVRLGPPRGFESKQFSTVVRDLEEVNSLISDLEADGKSMPVLLRQYLKLNAVLLGFNLDPDFGDVLDGLMLVDMTKMDTNIRRRYLGKEASAKFMAYHGMSED